MEVKTVGVACDHAGFALKKFVLQYLEEKGYPYKVLDEKLGFTGENVYNQVKKLLA